MFDLDINHVCTAECNAADRAAELTAFRAAKADRAADAERLAWVETTYRAAVRYDQLHRTYGESLYDES